MWGISQDANFIIKSSSTRYKTFPLLCFLKRIQWLPIVSRTSTFVSKCAECIDISGGKLCLFYKEVHDKHEWRQSRFANSRHWIPFVKGVAWDYVGEEQGVMSDNDEMQEDHGASPKIRSGKSRSRKHEPIR